VGYYHPTGKITQSLKIGFLQLKFEVVNFHFHISSVHGIKKVLLGDEHKHKLITLISFHLVKAKRHSFFIWLSFTE